MRIITYLILVYHIFKFSFLSFWTFPSHLCEMKQVEGSLLKVRENFMRYYQIIQKLHCLFLYFKNKVDIIFIPINIVLLKLLLLMTDMNVYSYVYDWRINTSNRRERVIEVVTRGPLPYYTTIQRKNFIPMVKYN